MKYSSYTDIKYVLVEIFESAECTDNTDLNAYLLLYLIRLVMRSVDLPMARQSVYRLCLSVKLFVVIFIRSALFCSVFNYFGVNCVLIYMGRVFQILSPRV